MKSSRVTHEEMADFVKTMIDRDIDHGRMTLVEQADYLGSIAKHIENIALKKQSELEELEKTGFKSTGEDRLEVEESDVEILPNIPNILAELFPNTKVVDLRENPLSRLDDLMEMVRPSDKKGLNPVQFIRSDRCLKGRDAHEWLYRHKFNVEYDHIHVFDGDMCLALGENEVKWVEPDRVRKQGLYIDVIEKMYDEYSKRSNQEID